MRQSNYRKYCLKDVIMRLEPKLSRQTPGLIPATVPTVPNTTTRLYHLSTNTPPHYLSIFRKYKVQYIDNY